MHSKTKEPLCRNHRALQAHYRLSADLGYEHINIEMSRRLIINRAQRILGQNTRTCFLCAPFLLRQKKWGKIQNVAIKQNGSDNLFYVTH